MCGSRGVSESFLSIILMSLGLEDSWDVGLGCEAVWQHRCLLRICAGLCPRCSGCIWSQSRSVSWHGISCAAHSFWVDPRIAHSCILWGFWELVEILWEGQLEEQVTYPGLMTLARCGILLSKALWGASAWKRDAPVLCSWCLANASLFPVTRFWESMAWFSGKPPFARARLSGAFPNYIWGREKETASFLPRKKGGPRRT